MQKQSLPTNWLLLTQPLSNSPSENSPPHTAEHDIRCYGIFLGPAGVSWGQMSWLYPLPTPFPPPTSSLWGSMRKRRPCAVQAIHLSQNPHNTITLCLWCLRGLSLEFLLATEWAGSLMMSRKNVRALPEMDRALTGSCRAEQRVNSVPHSLESHLGLYSMLGRKKAGLGILRGAKKLKCLPYCLLSICTMKLKVFFFFCMSHLISLPLSLAGGVHQP